MVSKFSARCRISWRKWVTFDEIFLQRPQRTLSWSNRWQLQRHRCRQTHTIRRDTLRVEDNGWTEWVSRHPWLNHTWWRHQMVIFFLLLALGAGNLPVKGEFPTQRPVTRSFAVFIDLRPNEPLSKQTWGWWFETLLRSLCRHCDELTISSETAFTNRD